jgi:putative flavoprotein involved in K+ transport
LTASTVIWATGFGLDHSWVKAPVFDGRDQVEHERGVTASPGLYFLGLPWLHTRGSALLGWVKDDAEHLATRIDAYRRAQRPQSAGSTSPRGHVPPAEHATTPATKTED